MSGETIFEFDAVAPVGAGAGVTEVPAEVFSWLERTCLQTAERGEAAWLRLTQRRGRRVVQVEVVIGDTAIPIGPGRRTRYVVNGPQHKRDGATGLQSEMEV